MRHRWGPPSRPDPHHTYRECIRPGCGCIKTTRHEAGRDWVEYGDGDKVTSTAPPCEGEPDAPAKRPPIVRQEPRMLTIRIVDIEHTGEDVDPAPIEFAWVTLYSTKADRRACGWELSPTNSASMLLDPGRPISPESSSVHHIIHEDIEDAEAPPWQDGIADMFDAARKSETPEPDYYAAFSADDDAKLIAPWVKAGTPWIDVHKVALRLWQDAPRWNLQTLRYWAAPKGMQRARATPAHRAYPDAYVAAFLLRDLLELASLDQMVAWSKEPALQVRCYYNPHRGVKWRDVDTGYLHWILSKDFPEDVVFTVRTELERREKEWERERQDQAAEAPQASYDEPPPYDNEEEPEDIGA